MNFSLEYWTLVCSVESDFIPREGHKIRYCTPESKNHETSRFLQIKRMGRRNVCLQIFFIWDKKIVICKNLSHFAINSESQLIDSWALNFWHKNFDIYLHDEV